MDPVKLDVRLDALVEATVQANHPEATREEWDHWDVEATRTRAEIVRANRRSRYAFRVVAVTIVLSVGLSLFAFLPGALVATAGLTAAALIGVE